MSGVEEGTVPAGRVLALDHGTVRTGVAVTDPSRTIASPLTVIQKAGSAAGLDELRTIIAEHEVVHVVVGLPTGLRGDTAQTQRARSFAARLRTQLSVPVEMYDERFTSRMADATSAATGSSTQRDALAASHLLESWLSAQR